MSLSRWERQRRIYRTMHQFAWCLTERYENLADSREMKIEAEGLPIWERAAEAHHGIVVVTAHIGNWEMGSMLPSRRQGRRVHAVREAEMDPRAQQFVQDLLEQRAGNRYVTHFASNDLTLALALREALEAGDIVALQGDRPRAGGKSVPVELLGLPTRFPVGPVALARATDAPLLPVFVFREGRTRYRVEVRPEIRVARGTHREADVADAVARIAADVGRAVRSRPRQWFCFRSLWG